MTIDRKRDDEADPFSDDPILADLYALDDALARDAEDAGEAPRHRKKSDFKTKDERDTFIEAWGLDAYRKLPA